MIQIKKTTPIQNSQPTKKKKILTQNKILRLYPTIKPNKSPKQELSHPNQIQRPSPRRLVQLPVAGEEQPWTAARNPADEPPSSGQH